MTMRLSKSFLEGCATGARAMRGPLRVDATRWARWMLTALAVVGLGQLRAAGQGRHMLPLIYGTPVTHEPFSGMRTLDYEPVEGSPDAVAVHAKEVFYRDSDGRTRSEITYEGQLTVVNIIDVVKGVRYEWSGSDKHVNSFPIKANVLASGGVGHDLTTPDNPAMVEGVKTRYTRTVRRVNGVDEVWEAWYSPELQRTLVQILDRPGVGKTTYRFQQIVRAEPDASLFRIPSGFVMVDSGNPPPPLPVKTSEVAGMTTSSQGAVVVASKEEAKVAGPAYLSDPRFVKALNEATTGRQTNEERLDNYKHANKVAKGECIQCLRAIIPLQVRMGAVKDAVNSAQQLLSVSTTDHDRLFAKAQLGGALMSYNYGQPKAEQVAQADAAFEEVLAKSPKSREVVYQDGRALAMLGKDAEAKAMFERYVDMVPASDKLRTRAERFSDDPHLATLPMAPPFRMVTAQGEELQLDEMGGKVVLLDFWATWCGPCKETLPEIARIAKEYANDPMVVVISVSQDADGGVWTDFVQKHNMTWPQYRDANKSLGNAYGVSSIPHFFTIDTNGVLRSEKVGSGADVHGMVADLVKKAHKAEVLKAKMADKAGLE